MANLYEIFGTDQKLEKEGIALEYGGGLTIVVARAGGANRAFANCISDKLRPHRAAMQNKTMDNELANQLLAETYAETVILGWEGVKTKGGKAISFSKENAVKLLLDLPDLFLDIQAQSQELANYLQEQRVEDSKS